MMKFGSLIRIIMAAALIFIFSGCGPSDDKSDPATEEEQPNLDLIIPSVTGGSININDYRGKVIILDFWASWCGPCRAEIPGFIQLYNKYKDQGLVIIGAAIDREDQVRSFYKYAKMNYPVGIATTADAIPFGGVRAFPTTYIIDRKGNIVKKHVGYRPKEAFEQEFLQLK